MDVHLVFNSFNKMLSISYETIFPAQALFLEHISSTYPYLLRELATLDLAKLITLMFDSVAKDGKMIHAKLTAILHAVNSQIFHDSESRQGLMYSTYSLNFEMRFFYIFVFNFHMLIRYSTSIIKL